MTEAVRDNRARQRYELDVDGSVAFIDYHRSGGVVTMQHAEVPPALQGRGIGSRLVRGALDLVRVERESVIPRCPFVADFMHKHPEVQDLLAKQS